MAVLTLKCFLIVSRLTIRKGPNVSKEVNMTLKTFTGVLLLLLLQLSIANQDSVGASRIMGITCWAES